MENLSNNTNMQYFINNAEDIILKVWEQIKRILVNIYNILKPIIPKYIARMKYLKRCRNRQKLYNKLKKKGSK